MIELFGNIVQRGMIMAITIGQMMTDAGLRRLAVEQAVKAQKDERRQEIMAQFRSTLKEVFGPLVEMLDMAVQTGEYSDSAHAMFGYESRLYRLSQGRNNWYLSRRDHRLSDDDWELPHTEIYAHYHNGLEANQDAFLLALAELAERPETPAKPQLQLNPTLEPRICNEFESALLDALRQFLQSEI